MATRSAATEVEDSRPKNGAVERLTSIDRRSGLSYAEFVQAYLMPCRPVIITDGLVDWPALKKWTPEFFRDVHGDRIVRVQGRDVSLGSFMEAVLASTDEAPSPYLSQVLVRQQFKEIAPDIEPDLKYTQPDWLRSRWLQRIIGLRNTRESIPELLIAGKGARFNLHYDAAHMLGFVTQIHGDKEFLVFAPEDGRYLYPRPDDPRHSLIPNIFDVDLKQFPAFAQSTPYRFVLRAGETIFNPGGWWHATRILSPSIAMVISTVNRSNWRAFVQDRSARRPGVPLPLSVGLRTYLALVGGLLTVQDWLFFRDPDSR